MCDLDIYNWLKSKGFVFSKTPRKGSSFIFSNGLFLNLRDNTHKISRWDRKDAYPHILMDKWLRELDNSLTFHVLRDDFNVVQICDASNFDFERVYIWIPPKKMTYEQEQSLMNWILFVSSMSTNIQCMMKDQIPWEYRVTTPSNYYGLTPEEIIKDIRKRYHKCVI